MAWGVVGSSTALAAGAIQVTTTADGTEMTEACTLRQAIESANTDSDMGGCLRTGEAPYTILVPAGVYRLNGSSGDDGNLSGDLDIRTDLTLVGEGATETIIQAAAVPGLAADRVMQVHGETDVTIRGVTIRYGIAPAGEDGGGLANMGSGTVMVLDSLVRANSSDSGEPGQGGGGLFNGVDGTLILHNTEVRANRATVRMGNGGGIFNSGTLLVHGGSITDNRAARAGGGIENFAGVVTLVDVTLDNNYTGINGAGLHTSGVGLVTMRAGSASGNVADMEGGGLWNSVAGVMVIDGVVIDSNIANGADPDQGGGGVFNDGGDTTILNSTITNNMASGASGSGGGIFNNKGTVIVRASTVNGNVSMRAGGGIEDNAGVSMTLINVTMDNNSTGAAPGNGGGLHITGPGTVLIRGGSASGNLAAAEGGGLWNSAVGTLRVDGMTIDGNTASGHDTEQGGGGVFNDGGTTTVINSTITNNVADGENGSGGGVLSVGGTLDVMDSMVEGNSPE
jgi:CSLREA domain-containing protein